MKSALEILRKCPFPKDVRATGIDKITDLLKSATKNRVGIKKATLVYEAAENSIGVPIGLDRARYRLNLIIRNLENIQKQINDIEIIMQKYLIETGYSEYILSIKGIGIVIASSSLAEIGDISKYSDYKQIQKVAGLNLKETSSGNKKGKTAISKRGRANLRSILYQAALVMAAKNEAFKEIYENLTKRDNNKLTGKQAIVALSVKIIKVIYALCTKKELYSHDKVHGLESYQKVA